MSISLKRRLILILSLLFLLAWIGSALLTGAYSVRVMLAQVDRQLEQYLDLVGYITKLYSRQFEQGEPLSAPLHWDMFRGAAGDSLPVVIETNPSRYQAPVLNIWLGERLLATLDESPEFERPGQSGFGFRTTGEGAQRWRILVRYDEDTELWLLVGVELRAARLALLTLFGQALLPLLILLPLTILLLYYGVSRGLLPMRLLAWQIARRNPRLLDAVPKEGVPAEVEPVVDALNALLSRLAQALESEQRFTANAAHELLTPLAAIKTEVQLCQRQLSDPDHREMLQRIASRVDRASHTVEQLLTLARVDPEAPLVTADVALRKLLLGALLETAHIASDREVEVDLVRGEEHTVQASAEALAILLRNVLVNAFRYADTGSTVRIHLAADDTGLELSICNCCPPLSFDEFQRISERFYRVPGSPGLGAGLGLSIVHRIADQHGARFTVGPEEDGSGFCARLYFGASVPAAVASL